MKHFVYIFALIFSLTISAYAEPRGGARDLDFDTSTKYVPKILELKGIVKSDGTHKEDCDVDLELVESETNKIHSISEPGELSQLHCAKEKDFLVSMKAERTPKFLFWGGNLKVQEFQVLEELESQPHIQAKDYNKDTFDRGAASRR